MNENNQVLAQNFAERLVYHRYVGFAPKCIAELALDYAEGRFDVAALVVGLQEVFMPPKEVVKHAAPIPTVPGYCVVDAP